MRERRRILGVRLDRLVCPLSRFEASLKLREIWAIRVRLELGDRQRRTKASLIYRRTKNLRAVQLLLGHTKLESTVRYLGLEIGVAEVEAKPYLYWSIPAYRYMHR